MSSREAVKEYVTRFAENGGYRILEEIREEFIIDCGGVIMTVVADEKEDWFMVYCRAMNLEDVSSNREILYRKLLSFNFGPTGNGAFALEPSKKYIVFRAQRNLSGLDWSEFLSLAENVFSVTTEFIEANE